MTQSYFGPECERAPDLIAFLYGEASQAEAQHFKHHIESCASCRSDLVAFGGIRESLGTWRQEALSSMIVSPGRSEPEIKINRPSAVAALREFFRLSPLWMKGAVAFASLLFFIFAALVIVRPGEEAGAPPAIENRVANKTEAAVENEEKEDRAEAKPELQAPLPQLASDEKAATQIRPKFQRSTNSALITPKPQRLPLTQEEREQLAADLRLISTNDEPDLDLLGDRLNRD